MVGAATERSECRPLLYIGYIARKSSDYRVIRHIQLIIIVDSSPQQRLRFILEINLNSCVILAVEVLQRIFGEIYDSFCIFLW